MRAGVPLGVAARLHAATQPDGIALIDEAVRWTWADLDRYADALADELAAAGIASGERVALLAVPSVPAVAALHGIARRGAVAAPLGTRLTARELTVAIAVVRPAIVLHDAGHAALAAALGLPVRALDAALGGSPTRSDPAAVDQGRPALAVLTSGTTGQPRVAILSDAALGASATAWIEFLPPAEAWLLCLGLGHVAGLGIVWRAAAAGVPLVALADADPRRVLAAFADDPAPTHVSLVPTQLVRLLDASGDRPAPPSLRAVLLGGGPIPAALVTRALEAGWPVVPTYGLTEAGSGVTALTTAEARAFPGSAGRALPGVGVRIERPGDDGVGEILITTPARFEGYLGDAAATEAALAADGSIRTGDLGWLDTDGRLLLVDRRSDLIVRGGENVAPAEVEAILVDHPAVAEAGVVGRADPEWGQVAVAAIVLRPGVDDPGDEALLLHCRERLAPYKVPTAFFRQPTLPRTASGKLRRAELRERLTPTGGSATAPAPDRLAQRRTLERPDGARLAYGVHGRGTPLLLLHATLSTGAQLGPLARTLAPGGGFEVIAVDRRGSGESRLGVPRSLEMSVHVADLAAILDTEGHAAAVLVGHSFGAVVALEFAARRPDRTIAVVAYEPPYAPVADGATRHRLAVVAAATERAYRLDGAAAAAETFVRGVAGDAAWDELSERRRSVLEGEGDGAVADVSLRGLDLDGLGRIVAPVALLTGDASQPFYAGIADALAARIPGASRVALPGLRHPAPITDPTPVAAAVLAALVAAGILPPPNAEAGAPSPSD